MMGSQKKKKKKQRRVAADKMICNEETRNENKENSIVDGDAEQRRATRLGAILALIAVVGVVFGVLFKLIRGMINVWSEGNFLYGYMQLLFSAVLSAAIIIAVKTISFIVTDLKRYNIDWERYKENDIQSDKKYFGLLRSVKIYMAVLGIALFILCLSTAWDTERCLRYMIYGFAALLLIYTIKLFFVSVREKKIKKQMKNIGNIIGQVIVLAFGTAFCYAICLSLATTTRTEIEVFYTQNGCVEICSRSSHEYGGLEIELYDAEEMIFSKEVELKNLLRAKEKLYFIDEIDGKTMGESIALDEEILHWKYIVDMKKMNIADGTYFIKIFIWQGENRVELINTLIVDGSNYIFATDVLKKSY